MDDGPVLLLRVLVSLLCVVGLIWVVARKVGATPGRRLPAGPSLQVVSRQSLGRHAGVAVLAVGNRRLLLGYGEQQVTMLTELAPVLDTAPTPGREVATRPAGTALPASLTAFVAARRGGRPTAAAVPADVPVTPPVADDVLLRAPLDIDALLAGAPTAPATATSAAPVAGVPATDPVGAPAHDAAPASAPAAARPTAPAPGAAAPAPARPATSAVPTQATTSALDGSILSPATWRRAVTSLQERTVRR
ncbi:flagellar biosynthetic protein FliO [Cellulomonas cellasea]|uniref:Flagellar protein FliO/FliZ n=1 Tax=Cellulomonas cellasea TaxID=43670 RepID=A0A7W4UHE6_9CELL|nr:flagellar biosynthetic protein FliO [Cellulomonas cellasea]MBB2924195.1 flagellar protein FliO/FliZ [Cellulomonas cellasea]